MMIYTAYFDKADTHGPSPRVILAAHVGHSYQWRRCHVKLDKIRRKYGFTIFHAKDYKAKAGEFSGWSDDKRSALFGEMVDLVGRTFTGGVSVYLEHSRYANEYRTAPVPRKMSLDSQLGVCFRACMRELVELLAERDYRDTLNIVMERGHPNARDCERIFKDLQKKYPMIGRNFLGSFTIATKEEALPLCYRIC